MSVANLLLTTSCLITEIPEKDNGKGADLAPAMIWAAEGGMGEEWAVWGNGRRYGWHGRNGRVLVMPLAGHRGLALTHVPSPKGRGENYNANPSPEGRGGVIEQHSKPRLQENYRIMAKDSLNLRPLDDRVVVEPKEAEEVTAGGIVLPDTAKEKPQRGTILAVGPGKLLDSGERGALSVSVGDEVIYGKYSGSEVEIDGREVKILRETDILAKVVK